MQSETLVPETLAPIKVRVREAAQQREDALFGHFIQLRRTERQRIQTEQQPQLARKDTLPALTDKVPIPPAAPAPSPHKHDAKSQKTQAHLAICLPPDELSSPNVDCEGLRWQKWIDKAFAKHQTERENALQVLLNPDGAVSSEHMGRLLNFMQTAALHERLPVLHALELTTSEPLLRFMEGGGPIVLRKWLVEVQCGLPPTTTGVTRKRKVPADESEEIIWNCVRVLHHLRIAPKRAHEDGLLVACEHLSPHPLVDELIASWRLPSPTEAPLALTSSSLPSLLLAPPLVPFQRPTDEPARPLEQPIVRAALGRPSLDQAHFDIPMDVAKPAQECTWEVVGKSQTSRAATKNKGQTAPELPKEAAVDATLGELSKLGQLLRETSGRGNPEIVPVVVRDPYGGCCEDGLLAGCSLWDEDDAAEIAATIARVTAMPEVCVDPVVAAPVMDVAQSGLPRKPSLDATWVPVKCMPWDDYFPDPTFELLSMSQGGGELRPPGEPL